MQYSVDQLIGQLTGGHESQKEVKKTEKIICKCSLGNLKANSSSTQSVEMFNNTKDCKKQFVCYFIVTEKYKAKLSTRGNKDSSKTSPVLFQPNTKERTNISLNSTNDCVSKLF